MDAPENLVLLHGFGGTRHTWDGVLRYLAPDRFRTTALDLPGHGEFAGAEPISFAATVASVLDRSPERFVLGGYSLGGRIALLVALTAPARVQRLVLVSTSAGIENDHERARRRVADEMLAAELEDGSFEEFVDRWRDQPMFAQDPPYVRERARAEQLGNSPAGLARSLRGVGAGQMTPLWDRLGELAMPVSLVVGTRDQKYRALDKRMLERLPDGRLLVLPGGHALALESPAALARALAALPQSG